MIHHRCRVADLRLNQVNIFITTEIEQFTTNIFAFSCSANIQLSTTTTETFYQKKHRTDRFSLCGNFLIEWKSHRTITKNLFKLSVIIENRNSSNDISKQRTVAADHRRQTSSHSSCPSSVLVKRLSRIDISIELNQDRLSFDLFLLNENDQFCFLNRVNVIFFFSLWSDKRIPFHRFYSIRKTKRKI